MLDFASICFAPLQGSRRSSPGCSRRPLGSSSEPDRRSRSTCGPFHAGRVASGFRRRDPCQGRSHSRVALATRR
jgi:hypothetical protein